MKRLLVAMIMLMLVLAVGAQTAFAGSASIDGGLTAGGPTLPVVFITTPLCTGQGASPVLYGVIPFSVDADGTYDIAVTSSAGFASMYLYANSFDPANPFVNCIGADNSGNPVTLSIALSAGTPYFLVPFDDTFAQVGGTYTADFSGPGTIFLGGVVVDACTYPLPDGSFVYSVPAGAPTFYDAKLDTKLNFDLPAGTWWISEFKGDFAKVWMSCQGQPIYIPTNAVQR